jgi:hypothetical protein
MGGVWGGIGAVISCWIRGEGRENYTLEERGAIGTIPKKGETLREGKRHNR